MRKKDTKPGETHARMEAPLGFMRIPPNAAMFDGNDTYIIITNKETAERVINEIFSPSGTASLPQ